MQVCIVGKTRVAGNFHNRIVAPDPGIFLKNLSALLRNIEYVEVC